ncbi:HalOD1 output domain-containing protein [Natrinema halophilum]|uniref:HalOD1 output domain-containing protein n=1 Tax=Natrinema halophilum TaxID=1699371 RepID=UPI001F3653D3|nr:HalOD1 output domain-containing protein [Natrinema halophilum]UHQ96343.1 hypothetical protein HYG82_22045 [Natrinema halophilum]
MTGNELNSPTIAVVGSIADKEGTAPTDLHPPLHDVIDTDALDRVVESFSENDSIQFQYLEYTVTVYNNNEVEVLTVTGAKSECENPS